MPQGALMQLVAYGAQDVYLTGNPQITFFKVVYRRHTNFSMESILQSITGTSQYGQIITTSVSRNGDLLGPCYLQAKLDTTGTAANGSRIYTPRPGYNLIKYVEFQIGGTTIDKHSGMWMDVWSELSSSYDQTLQLDSLVGTRAQERTATTGNTLAVSSGLPSGTSSKDDQRVHVPLQFSFCRNPGLALPLIALQYHEVKIIISLQDKNKMTRLTDAATTDNSELSLSNVDLWCDYIFLDTEERQKFASTKHEYLIEQVQETSEPAKDNEEVNIPLNFNHPVKELVWVYSNGELGNTSTFGNYTDVVTDASYNGSAGSNPCTSAHLELNNMNRFKERNGSFFNNVQPYQVHSGNPSTGINCYSFALNPEEHQPSGTCNFSRIDRARLIVKSGASVVANKPNINVFAHSYNVLRITGGMGGLAYSN